MGWKGANVKRRVDWDGVLISLLWIDSRVMQCNRMISNSSGSDLGGEVMREDFKHFIQFQSRRRDHSISILTGFDEYTHTTTQIHMEHEKPGTIQPNHVTRS